MASTYSNLKFQLMATGENSGTWGNVTNVNLGTAIEEAIVGSADVSFSSADVTLSLADTNASQAARNLRLNLTGTSGGNRNLVVPAIEKVYIINNGLANQVTVKNATGTGVVVPAGKTMYVYNDGTNVVDAITHLTSLTTGALSATSVSGNGAGVTSLNASNVSTGTLAVARGGTGQASLTANNVLIGNGTSGVNFVAPGTSGNVLTSNGTSWSSQGLTIPDPIPSGTSMLFVQTSAPTGWTKSTTHNNKALRVVSGTAGSGGSVAFTSAFTTQAASGTVGDTSAGGTVESTTLSNNQIPSHTHGAAVIGSSNGSTARFGAGRNEANNFANANTKATGGGGSHNHNFSGTSHSHTFTGSSIDLSVQYVDVIIATKN